MTIIPKYMRAGFVLLALLPLLCAAMSAAPGDYFSITVTDEATGRGVPLVELRTVNETRFVTDSSGIAAINDPDLMGQKVYFHVSSPGYEYPADGFGNRGTSAASDARRQRRH